MFLFHCVSVPVCIPVTRFLSPPLTLSVRPSVCPPVFFFFLSVKALGSVGCTMRRLFLSDCGITAAGITSLCAGAVGGEFSGSSKGRVECGGARRGECQSACSCSDNEEEKGEEDEMGGRGLGTYGSCVRAGRHLWLEELDLARNGVGDVGAQALKSLLLASPRLRRLELQDCGVGARGALLLGEGMAGAQGTVVGASRACAGRVCTAISGVDAFWFF
jgi:hypothetical protein